MHTRLVIAGLVTLALLASACDRDSGPRPTPTERASTVTATAPVPSVTAAAPTRTPAVAPECVGSLDSYRSLGLVRLTIRPVAPRTGNLVTVTGDGIRAGRYDIHVSDLDEVSVKVGEVEVGSDLRIMATFVMPDFARIYSGNPFAPCVVVSIPVATNNGERFVSEYFRRSDP